MTKRKTQKGFTLVEMLVAVAIFSLVMIMATAMMLSIVEANYEAQGLKSTLDNLNVALDEMTRSLRVGTNFSATTNYCGSSISIPPNSNSLLSFTSQTGVETTYAFVPPSGTTPGILYRCENININGASQPQVLPLAGGEGLSITNPTSFTLENSTGCPPSGSDVLPTALPYVFIIVSGTATNGTTVSNFNIETTVSERSCASSNTLL